MVGTYDIQLLFLGTANPAIQAVSDIVTIEAGSSGQLKVYVSGVPDPTSTSITWFKVGPGGNKTELNEPTVNFSSDHRTLLLSNVQDRDGGTYMCIVTQSVLPLHSSSIKVIIGKNVRSSALSINKSSFGWPFPSRRKVRLKCCYSCHVDDLCHLFR